jgi:Cu(I)-responsive transcriptional regulator
MPPITIGALAKATETKATTIRFYEKIGLLPPAARTSGNYRNYGDDHVRRLTFVRRARDLGFSLEIIQQLLSLADNPEQSCGRVMEVVSDQLRVVEEKITHLQRLNEQLHQLTHQCGGTEQPHGCKIIEALFP